MQNTRKKKLALNAKTEAVSFKRKIQRQESQIVALELQNRKMLGIIGRLVHLIGGSQADGGKYNTSELALENSKAQKQKNSSHVVKGVKAQNGADRPLHTNIDPFGGENQIRIKGVFDETRPFLPEAVQGAEMLIYRNLVDHTAILTHRKIQGVECGVQRKSADRLRHTSINFDEPQLSLPEAVHAGIMAYRGADCPENLHPFGKAQNGSVAYDGIYAEKMPFGDVDCPETLRLFGGAQNSSVTQGGVYAEGGENTSYAETQAYEGVDCSENLHMSDGAQNNSEPHGGIHTERKNSVSFTETMAYEGVDCSETLHPTAGGAQNKSEVHGGSADADQTQINDVKDLFKEIDTDSAFNLVYYILDSGPNSDSSFNLSSTYCAENDGQS
ncbi:hypothetical protein ElyMa_002512200 [Elysia marginata]|uniref:BZIP domain-containing protein n=1 Tax=Elysia marginata TaxID=1093978 RepID=A0AAV4GSH1_9GAST|nr:hypothetical protein ElyMa_002512200 [Elysia marginata]